MTFWADWSIFKNLVIYICKSFLQNRFVIFLHRTHLFFLDSPEWNEGLWTWTLGWEGQHLRAEKCCEQGKTMQGLGWAKLVNFKNKHGLFCCDRFMKNEDSPFTERSIFGGGCTGNLKRLSWGTVSRVFLNCWMRARLPFGTSRLIFSDISSLKQCVSVLTSFSLARYF